MLLAGRCQPVEHAPGVFVLRIGGEQTLEDLDRALGLALEADILVVGINDDPVVSKLKGPGRPVIKAEERASLVAAIEWVDFVLIFPEDTVEQLLTDLRPHVHCKGTDYTKETVPEREVAARLGIDIAITGDPKSHSTRDLIQQVLTTLK